jgi:hypothetical protein
MARKKREERRQNLRVPFVTEVNITALDGSGRVSTEMSKDISMKGIYCFTENPLPQGTRCLIEIVLTGTSTELKIRIEGHVVRTEPGGMALFFDALDLDAFIHLKNVLYYNSGDPERIDRETGLI